MSRLPCLLLVLLAACAPSPSIVGSGATPSLPPTPAAESTTPSAAEVTAPPLDTVLPTELGGVELHTFAVGQESLERLAGRLAVDAAAVDARYASEHGERFLQMYALRVPGVTGDALLEAWAVSAYPPDAGDVTVAKEEIAGRTVSVIHSPNAAIRFGTYYAYVIGDTLLVVQAFDPEAAAEVLAALPP